ncbi:biotin-dependent carboxyltransferase family protein [Eudoraea chungangensis]|uniref:5-oxoprolinase subunit C family protein n=1 Tax=Eudoraea chungangensis TaxID=1481905 RepID=UPI0023EB7C46|nr:biotin-dependent carboxyltransferase family protein [Eudoraea chungangensis]
MIKVIRSGFFTTIQDSGRFDLRHKGVPISGAMDLYSAAIANSMLDNHKKYAVMEITMTGPKLQFSVATYFCISGAEMSPSLNTKPINNYEVLKANKGDILSFGKLTSGFRTYLAVKDGFNTEIKLGSRSFFKPITPLNCVIDGMEIDISECKSYTPKILEMKSESLHHFDEISAYPGPEYDLLNTNAIKSLFSKKFTIAKENNRMAYQFVEPLMEHKHKMLTSATLPGTVQLTPAGKLIILMSDGQTTGGYPRILQLSKRAIAILAQKRSGDTIAFKKHPYSL